MTLNMNLLTRVVYLKEEMVLVNIIQEILMVVALPKDKWETKLKWMMIMERQTSFSIRMRTHR